MQAHDKAIEKKAAAVMDNFVQQQAHDKAIEKKAAAVMDNFVQQLGEEKPEIFLQHPPSRKDMSSALSLSHPPLPLRCYNLKPRLSTLGADEALGV